MFLMISLLELEFKFTFELLDIYISYEVIDTKCNCFRLLLLLYTTKLFIIDVIIVIEEIIFQRELLS